MQDRPFDIILWGATGHTGRPAALYLQRQYGNRLRWAIAGRDRARLERVRAEIGNPELPIFIVPGSDRAAADQVAPQTRVLASTVAPGARYASEMVAACIAHGTHMADLCGELHWLRHMMDTHDPAAQAGKVKIVNCCGLDSIPSEYLVHRMQQGALAQYGEYCTHITNFFSHGHIAVSGGSFASGKGVMEAVASDPAMADMIANPYSLNPPDQLQGPHCPDLEQVQFDADFGQWVMPFPLGQINARVVRRSHALLGYPWGDQFTYREAKLAGRGPLKRLQAELETRLTRLFVEADPRSRSGRLLHRLGPKEGSGPTDRQIARNGPCGFKAVGVTASGKKLKGWMHTHWDPGHGGTAAMLVDAAYCLARRQDEIEAESGRSGGFLTPYLAMGEVLREQLQANAGIHWGLESAV
ncbi:MAG: saccharopine dehydrogenase NADP-binding domain-containing protein [Pseudomonadota bacterium]|nr:saccharopine dehydrogenase NADP-binding domain-containing protein [Pseudomonadota bacterium]